MKRVLLAVLLCTPALVRAQISISTPVAVTLNPKANSPSVHFARNGSLYVSWFAGDTAVYFAHSTDAGLTFSKAVVAARVASPAQFNTSLQRVPEFAIDTKGTIHMVFGKTTPGIWHGDLWYVRSTDQGASWTPPVSIMDPDDSENYPLQFYSIDFPAIACDSSDNLYVSYLDNRYLERGVIHHYVMHFTGSTDGGTTWSLPVIANKLPIDTSGTCECCRQDIAVSKDGHVFIAFRSNMNVSRRLDDRSIFICRSKDKGITWDSSIRCQLGSWNLDACPTKGPVIALTPSQELFIAWCDARDDTGRLVSYISMLRGADSTVFPNVSISTPAQQAVWPYIAISPSELIAYAYLPSQGSGRMQFTYSSDGGNTWLRNQNMPGTVADNISGPSLAFSGDTVCYVVWQDGSAGIMCSAIRGFRQTQIPQAVVPYLPASYSANKRVTLRWCRPPNLGAAPFVWYGPSIFQYQDTSKRNSIEITGLRDTFITLDSLPVGIESPYTMVVWTSSIMYAGVESIPDSFAFVQQASVSADTRSGQSLYPNPSSGFVTVRMPDLGNEPLQITIFNSLGVQVKSERVQAVGECLTLNLQDLAAGVYSCRLGAGTGTRLLQMTIVH